ncbi:putative quinol monooxygenase [Ferrimonas kyonanensis]|uniref:putative quinol monooxygenase n=1 Tax=Ferrimonas kyonanensis TaxID=364763 RepID=UPI00041EA70F|nr:putative quinol monooxygenase [Ferrimonas kyonanensis]
MSQDLVFTVEFNIKPHAREAFLASLTQLVTAMATEETFVSTYLHQDAEDANKFLIYERWSEPSMDAFMENQLRGKAYRDEYEAQLPDWSASPRKISVLRPLGLWQSQ